jgi:hypothetical protein
MAAHLPHAPPPQAKPKRMVDLGHFLLLSLFTPAVITTVTCKRRKKHKQSFGSSSLF